MKSKIIFVMAIMMGLITTVLFFNYMKQYDDVTVANDSLVEVVAVKQPIKKNQIIHSGMLELKQVPKLALHPQTVMSLVEAEGKLSNADLEPGEVLLQSRLNGVKEESRLVARKIREGFRAVSVGVNMVRSVSNLIEPDDVVDIVFTPPASNGDPAISKLLLEKIRVLAVGRRMVEENAEHRYVEYSSVTLEVEPQDTVSLVNAMETGTINLVLHSRVVPAEGGIEK